MIMFSQGLQMQLMLIIYSNFNLILCLKCLKSFILVYKSSILLKLDSFDLVKLS